MRLAASAALAAAEAPTPTEKVAAVMSVYRPTFEAAGADATTVVLTHSAALLTAALVAMLIASDVDGRVAVRQALEVLGVDHDAV